MCLCNSTYTEAKLSGQFYHGFTELKLRSSGLVASTFTCRPIHPKGPPRWFLNVTIKISLYIELIKQFQLQFSTLPCENKFLLIRLLWDLSELKWESAVFPTGVKHQCCLQLCWPGVEAHTQNSNTRKLRLRDWAFRTNRDCKSEIDSISPIPKSKQNKVNKTPKLLTNDPPPSKKFPVCYWGSWNDLKVDILEVTHQSRSRPRHLRYLPSAGGWNEPYELINHVGIFFQEAKWWPFTLQVSSTTLQFILYP